MQCPNCGKHSQGARFCPQCGERIPTEVELPHVGEDIHATLYRITFEPVEGVFLDPALAEDAAENAYWNEDRPLGGFTVESIRTAVPENEYPYLCGNCKETVSDTTEGRCSGCGETNWVRR